MAPPNSSSPSSPVGNGSHPAVAWEAEEEYKYPCKFCRKRFSSRQALAGHCNLHRPVNNDPYAVLQGLRRQALECRHKLMAALARRARQARIRPDMAVPSPPAFGESPLFRVDLVSGLIGVFELVAADWRRMHPVARAQVPGAFPMPKEDGAAGTEAVGMAGFNPPPPPDFGDVLRPELDFPAASSNMKRVKKEVITID